MSSPIVQNVPGSNRLDTARIVVFAPFGGVFVKYPAQVDLSVVFALEGSDGARSPGSGTLDKETMQMTPATDESHAGSSKLSGVLKLVGALALALLALLVVFDILPRTVLGEFATKILLAACILGLASAGIAFLTRSGRS